MHDMSNEALVQAFPYRKQLAFEKRLLEEQIERLQVQCDQLGEEVRALESITEIFEGVALDVSTRGALPDAVEVTVWAVTADIERRAEVYTTKDGIAHDWCIRIWDHLNENSRSVERWLGNGFGLRDATMLAKQWVARGVKPSDDTLRMYQRLHAIDPKREISKRRRDAFEAAWLADKQELAEQILLEGQTLRKQRAKKALLEKKRHAKKAARTHARSK